MKPGWHVDESPLICAVGRPALLGDVQGAWSKGPPRSAGSNGCPRGAWSNVPVLTLDDALRLLDAARNAAGETGVPMAFAVMDAGGHLLALTRMDGAPWITSDVAQGKAWTSAAYGVPSAAQKEKMAPMPVFATAVTAMTHGRFTPQTGAVPVYRDGVLLGALGASGGTGEQDEAACSSAVGAEGFSTSR